ncbi:MAG: helix-turn-helix domain-containing protein [Nanoarchaeota archaeon]|nr:helix-turn-helix domain-containing protein [Nanoarchaeota archaeon]
MTKNLNGEMDILLALFKNPDKELSASGLAQLVGLSRMGALLVVRKLVAEGLLKVRKIGKSSIYSLDPSDSHTRKYLIFLLSREAERATPYARRWIAELRRLKNAKAAILFGSVLRKENGARDIDAVLITDEKRFDALEKEIDAMNRINSKPIHAVYQLSGDFRKNLQKKDSVILNALKGIVAFGEEVVLHESSGE